MWLWFYIVSVLFIIALKKASNEQYKKKLRSPENYAVCMPFFFYLKKNIILFFNSNLKLKLLFPYTLHLCNATSMFNITIKYSSPVTVDKGHVTFIPKSKICTARVGSYIN